MNFPGLVNRWFIVPRGLDKEDMLFKLYSSISAQSMERIEELLQEDQNVKRRKERIQKQSSILSKLTTQLCINDNLAAAASTYSNEGDLFYDYKSVYSYKFKVQPLLAHLPGRSGDATFDAAASGPNLSYGDSRSNCLSRRNSDPFHNGDITLVPTNTLAFAIAPPSSANLFIYSKKVQPLLAHLPGRSGDATFDAAASGPNLSYGDSRSNCLSRRNSDPFIMVYLTITLEKMAKGDAQKLYFTALTTYMELLDLKPLPVTALANGTYEKLYRYIHFNPIQTKGLDKEDMLFKLYSSISAQSMERIEELLQEDQNVKRRKERIQKQSSILSKLTTQLCINDNLAAAASTYSNEVESSTIAGPSSREVCLTITLEKMAKGDAQKLYFTALTTYMELLDLKPLPVTALANGTYEELYRYIHFNPIQTKGLDKEDMLFKLYSSISAQSMERIEELLQEDQNVKRRKERIHKQSSILSKLTTQLCINDNLAAAASTYSNEVESSTIAGPSSREVYLTITLGKMAKGDAQKLYFTALTTYMELLDLKPFPVTALANGTYEELYRYIHFNPIQTKGLDKEDMLFKLYSSISGQSMERIEELLQEDQNVKRRKERIQKQSSILSKLTTQLCINDNLAAAASTYSNEVESSTIAGPSSREVYLTITLEKMAKGDAQKLYFTALTTYMELLDLKPLPVTALANGTYEELYRYIHFNPIQTKGLDKEDMLFKLYSSISGQSMERIEELLQEDQNVKRRKERIQKQSSILSKLTTQLCINDNLAAAASTYSNEVESSTIAGPSSREVYLTITLGKMAKGDAQKLYFTALTTYMELLDLKPFPVTALANGTYEELYRYIHFNPIQTKGLDKEDMLFKLYSSISGQSMERIEELLQEDQNVKRRKERIQKQSSILSKLTTQLCINDNLAAAASTYSNEGDLFYDYKSVYSYKFKVQPLLAHLPGRSGDATFDAAASGPNLSYGDSRSNCLSRRNSDPFHNGLFAITLEKMAKGDAQKLYFTALTTYMELLDLKPLPVTALANGTYEELYRYIHFNPIQTKGLDKEDMLFKLYSSISGQSMERIEELLQEDQNVKRRKERIQKQSSILSKLTTQLCINDNLAAAASTYSNEVESSTIAGPSSREVYLTITLEKMAKGDAQKLYFTALTTYMELLDLKPLPVTALANGTYEELYRYIHFNPIQTKGLDKEDMLFKLYSSISGQSMERIEELLQEDQNVKRRKERIQKQSSILSKLTTQLCINDNLAAAASIYSNEVESSTIAGPSSREVYLTITLEKMAKGDAQKLYFTALTTYMELLDLKPLPVTALANGTYEELYRYIHFNPIQTKNPGQDELSRLGEQMVHSSEGKRALARWSKHGKNRRASPGGPECQAEERAYPETKVQPLLAHLPGSSGDATFDTAASGPNLSYGDSRSNCLSRRNSDPFHNECFYTMSFRNLMLPEALTTYMELLDLKPFPVTALANGTYEELYRYIHFNPIQKKTPGQDELSRLGEQMVHSSEGKRALARVLCHELHDKFLQHVLKAWQEWKCFSRRTIMSSGGKSKVHPLLAHLPGRSGDAAFDAAASGPNPSYVDSRSMGPSRWNSDPFQNDVHDILISIYFYFSIYDAITNGIFLLCSADSEIRNIKEKLHTVSIVQVLILILAMLEERGEDLDRLYEMEDKGIGAIIRCTPGRKDSENAHIHHSELFTLTEKMAKGDAQKL
ncbi:hypothetical protein SASPL_133410 [Salvia splendens]|uniref:Uncharacterized protein n=1 Tax=Salvia splendens TaxID=180675 RepID=A0A8X8X2M9_SALSN|nr:hypothetical protein SASPL_133410 [Salvia splendens]